MDLTQFNLNLSSNLTQYQSPNDPNNTDLLTSNRTTTHMTSTTNVYPSEIDLHDLNYVI